MDKHYNSSEAEAKWYTVWEEKGYFKPEVNPHGKPYAIVLPPPNASGKMHTGNVLMIAIEDLLIRWRRMKGDAALWVPGTDHAGTETQITFERELKKQGKSRFQYTRAELYDAIWQFVQENKHNIENQIRQMGASIDWSRYRFTLDPSVVTTVHETFEKLCNDGLIYRGEYMVNYCPKCGTTYADVEISHEERKDPLYYIRYQLVDSKDHITVATVRPEPIWADTHLAVNPKDAKKAQLIGKKVKNPLSEEDMTIIADDFVDPAFGTGIVKLTPGIDKNDYDVALKHSLPITSVMDLNGKMKGRYAGLSVTDARKKALEELEAKGSIEKIDTAYTHTVSLCKAGHPIEPMVMPNWFVKVDEPGKSLKQPAYEAVKEGRVKIFPKWREVTYLRWMEEMRDWPVSRQNVWGIQIPIWYRVENPEQFYVWFVDENGAYHNGKLSDFFDQGIAFETILHGLQRVVAEAGTPWVFGKEKDENQQYLPETDTFDTWFSSGQWPLVTLGYPESDDFEKFYPTQVLETGWEIIRLWVSRMIMFGLYLTNDVPFQHVYLHGIVRAIDGRKMSKSLGNVINPEEYITQYGVDALRMGLISGTANGKDFAFPKDRIIAYKLFANKIWNMARFMLLLAEQNSVDLSKPLDLSSENLQGEDKRVYTQLQEVMREVETALEKYRFADAGEALYQFMWHTLADQYIEHVKEREDTAYALLVFKEVYVTSLKLLHPFMPYVTEEIYQHIPGHSDSIMIEKWPEITKNE
jgi:valyl-tRNA synthetase